MKKNCIYLLSYFLGTIIYLFGLNLAMSGYIRLTNQDANYLLVFIIIWWPIIVLYWILRNQKVNWFTFPFISLFPLLAIFLSYCSLILFVANAVPWQTIEFPENNLRIYTNGDIIGEPLCHSFFLRQEKEVFPYILFVKDFPLGESTEIQNCSQFSYEVLNENEILINTGETDSAKEGEEFRFYLKNNVYY